jgi:hypothetical protein
MNKETSHMSSAAPALPLANSIAVDSSTLATLAYDDERGALQVEFFDRTVYQYLAVPRTTYEELCRAESKGAHFNRYIRTRFACVTMPPKLPSLG